MDYKHKLDKSSRKYYCPNCGKKTLVRFVDSKSGELQSEEFGRCDREDSCRYFSYPKTNWLEYGNVAKSLSIRNKASCSSNKQAQVFIPWESYSSFLSGYDNCQFFDYLSSKGVPDELLEKVIEMYYLGTNQSEYLRGALTIPYINTDDKIAFVQVKQFDESNKTVKTSALHSILKGKPGNDWVDDYENNNGKVTCFFGAHLLNRYPNNPVILVEAPKTAIYGTCYYGPPKDDKRFLWLAVYNKSSLTEERFKILEGRTVLLIPDLSIGSHTFNEWQEKALKYAKKLNNTKVSFLDFLEVNAPDELRNSGGDLADYLDHFSWQEYQNGNKGDESVKSDINKKHFSRTGNLETQKTEIMHLFQPQTGYSTKAIVKLVSPIEYFRKLKDYQIIAYLIDSRFIVQDFERDNYYLSGSTPF
jgi:predicted RNA-binding Zn-ribbon protein involved in translation (DUF1610 family)